MQNFKIFRATASMKSIVKMAIFICVINFQYYWLVKEFE